jgi:Holliday junction resolvasome RuvABC endonuclease subunit
MNILSLDIASVTGWAVSNEIYGTWDLKTLKDESMGMKLIRFRAKLREVLDLEKIEVVLYERPAGRHANSVIHQSKMIAIVEEEVESRSINYRAYSAKEIKSFATDNGNASKADMVKAAQKKYGMEGSDDNVADALHMLNLFKTEIYGS